MRVARIIVCNSCPYFAGDQHEQATLQLDFCWFDLLYGRNTGNCDILSCLFSGWFPVQDTLCLNQLTNEVFSLF